MNDHELVYAEYFPGPDALKGEGYWGCSCGASGLATVRESHRTIRLRTRVRSNWRKHTKR